MDRTNYYRDRALNLIESIEDKTKEMFHVTHPDLAHRHCDCMDGKYKWHHFIESLNKEIDKLNSLQN